MNIFQIIAKLFNFINYEIIQRKFEKVFLVEEERVIHLELFKLCNFNILVKI